MSFENLIGNEEVKRMLNTTIQNQTVLHSYLFIGQEGIGKKKFAEEFAKMILCTSEKKPCHHCKSCIEFDSKNHPDFIEIFSENDTIKIEVIRNMQTKIIERPIVSNHKVYIIDNAETMTREAQNCLLKTLEEPPEYITIILITSNESKLLNTIKSRCTKIFFCGIPDELLQKFLEKEYGYTNLTEDWIQTFEGSIQKAIQIYNKQENYTQIKDIFTNIENYTILDVLNKIDGLYKNKEDIEDLLNYINLILYHQIEKHPNYISYIEAVEDTKNRLKRNSNYDMCIDHLLFRIWEEKA